MRVDGALADAVHPLELSRRAQVVQLKPAVHGSKKEEQQNEDRQQDREDDQRKARPRQIDEEHVEGPSKDLIHAVDVTRDGRKEISISKEIPPLSPRHKDPAGARITTSIA